MGNCTQYYKRYNIVVIKINQSPFEKHDKTLRLLKLRQPCWYKVSGVKQNILIKKNILLWVVISVSIIFHKNNDRSLLILL